MTMARSEAIRGVGIGLRAPHAAELASGRPRVAWLEVLADNYFAPGGPHHRLLEEVTRHYPVTFHTVGMSLGSVEPLDRDYFQRLKALAEQHQPAWLSDHLCFSSAAGKQFHDLLPLPYTEEALQHVCARIRQVQDWVGDRILVENISSYVRYQHSTMGEAEFLTAVAEQADCRLLLDLNNVHVNACNHGEDARAFLDAIPLERVGQIHLGGYQDRGDFLLDAHDHPVSEPVWALFAWWARHAPEVPVLIEWDNDIPELPVLLQQAGQAEHILGSARPPATGASC